MKAAIKAQPVPDDEQVAAPILTRIAPLSIPLFCQHMSNVMKPRIQ